MAVVELDLAKLLEGEFLAEANFTATLEGMTPILMHSPQGMRVHDPNPSRAGKSIPSPEEEAEAGAYRDESGVLSMPAVAIQRTMIEAAKQYRDPNNTRATLMKKMAATLALPEQEFFPLTREGELLTKYEIDTRRAVVQRNAVMRSRPKIATPWELEVTMGYDPTLMSPEQIARIMMVAGQQIGIGDYRPERSGPFGRFRVIRFLVQEGEVPIEEEVPA
jgi:hypothetical protein